MCPILPPAGWLANLSVETGLGVSYVYGLKGGYCFELPKHMMTVDELLRLAFPRCVLARRILLIVLLVLVCVVLS